ncbi:MAG: helix-turn-helix domain-containing protein [Actinomycetota bacterium]
MNQRTSTLPDPNEDDGGRHDVIRPERLLYSVREAAELLSIGRVKLYELVAAGRIASVRLDGSRKIPRTALEEFIAQLRAESDIP